MDDKHSRTHSCPPSKRARRESENSEEEKVRIFRFSNRFFPRYFRFGTIEQLFAFPLLYDEVLFTSIRFLKIDEIVFDVLILNVKLDDRRMQFSLRLSDCPGLSQTDKMP